MTPDSRAESVRILNEYRRRRRNIDQSERSEVERIMERREAKVAS